jgi:NADPH:quinone reductase-like Zn-dependent oxidoreductase
MIRRREFIGAVAAGTLMFIKPGLVRGSDANSAVRVGLIGCGGRGSADATSIASNTPARIVALADMFDDQLQKAKELGADEAVLHSKQDFAKEVKKLTNHRGVDVVIEHVGEATWNQSIHSLAPGGRLVTCGATTGWEGEIDIRYLFTRHLSILGSFMGYKSELYDVLELVSRGLLKPVIDKVMPLGRCAEAHARLEHREQFGKIVLQV